MLRPLRTVKCQQSWNTNLVVLGQLPPRKIAPRKLPPHHKVSPGNNCPHLNKLPSKTTASELRKTMHCLRVLQLKNHSNKSYFSRLQLKSKKCFTSVYFLQILTKPRRTPLIREHLSLNASWFSYEQKQKKYILEKLIRKKIQKNFIVNNNNKIICAWYLSSK